MRLNSPAESGVEGQGLLFKHSQPLAEEDDLGLVLFPRADKKRNGGIDGKNPM